MILDEMEEPNYGRLKDLADSSSTDLKQRGPGSCSSAGGWTEEEDKTLELAVRKYGEKSWRSIAKHVPNRTNAQCFHRWKKVLNPCIIKGTWTKEEDDLIMEMVGKQGLGNWSKIAKHLPGRLGKQCRDRWHNHLNPEINKTGWTEEEDTILLEAHGIYGNKWAEIVRFLPGRAENSIKNHWNGLMNKKTLKLGTLNHSRPITLGSNSNIEPDNRPWLRCKSASPGRSREISVTTSTTPDKYDGLSPTKWKKGYQNENYGCLCYQPLMIEDLNVLLETGSFPCTDGYLKHTTVVGKCSGRRTSPESFLRSAARTFTNMPSIIRKRSSFVFK